MLSRPGKYNTNSERIVQLINNLGVNVKNCAVVAWKNCIYFIKLYFCVYVPINLTILKWPLLVKNCPKHGHFFGRDGLNKLHSHFSFQDILTLMFDFLSHYCLPYASLSHDGWYNVWYDVVSPDASSSYADSSQSVCHMRQLAIWARRLAVTPMRTFC